MRATFQDVGANSDGEDDQFCGQEDPSANASTIDTDWTPPGEEGRNVDTAALRGDRNLTADLDEHAQGGGVALHLVMVKPEALEQVTQRSAPCGRR